MEEDKLNREDTGEDSEQETIKKRFPDWKIGDYIRQLSVVVLGIVVTFIGSDIIGDYYKQREVRSAMQLVKEELIQNQKSIKVVGGLWRQDSHISRLLMEHKFQCQDIPNDTLCRYMRILTSVDQFTVNADALDVLKSSGLLQQIPDKDFMLKLVKAYRVLRDLEKSDSGVVGQKEKVWEAITAHGMSKEDEELSTMGNCMDKYKVYLGYQEMRSYITSLPYFFNSDIYAEADSIIAETIRAIEQKYE